MSFIAVLIILLVLTGNWVVHKFRQFKLRIKQLEGECEQLNKMILKYGKQKK